MDKRDENCVSVTMSQYWKPVVPPPRLDRLCHLSQDAQLLMAAIYKQYQLQKEAQRVSKHSLALVKEGISDYYCEIYSKWFGGLPLSRYSPNTWEGDRGDTFEDGTSEISCPVVPKSPYFTDTAAVVPESPYFTDTAAVVPKSPYFTDTAAESCKRYCNNTISTISADCDSVNSVDVFKTNLSADVEQLVDLQNLPSDNMMSDKHSPILLQSEDQNISTLTCVNKIHVDEKIFHQQRKTDSVSLENGSHKSHNLNVSAPNKTSQQNDTSQNPPLCSINRKLNEHAVIREKKIHGQQIQSEQRPISVDITGDIKPQQSARKHPGTASISSLDIKSSHFFVPYKKQKLFLSTKIPVPDKNVECQDKDNSTVDVLDFRVDHLNREKLTSLAQQLLHSPEVLLSLIYADKSTQLRDNSSLNSKKRTNYGRNKKIAEVEFICVSTLYAICISDINRDQEYHIKKVWTFPISSDSLYYQEWSRKFWKDLMLTDNRKICCDAKQLFLVLVQELQVLDVKDCVVLDPAVAAWLLDSDAEVSTFQQCLSMVCLQQKDLVCKFGSDVLHDDMLLMSELMKRLHQKLLSRGLWDLFYCVEMKLVPLLAVMELRPLKTAADTLLKFSDVLKKKLRKLEQKAFQVVGHSFLISSPAQLRQVMFEELQLDKKMIGMKLAKTHVGHQTSTSEAVLNQLADLHPLPSIILEYRQFQKLKSTYVDGMMSCIKDGYLYTHWDQTSAATGRLSSYQPNIQTIPKAPVVITDYTDNFIIGKENNEKLEIFARDVFVSHQGFSFLAADFQQIELRLLAHLADDPVLLQIFNKSDNVDIFLQLTSQWLSKPVEDVTTQDREQTKRVVYSVMYGAGKEKLAEYLKISSDDAKAIMNSFLVKFPAVNQFSRKCIEYCQQNVFVSPTLLSLIRTFGIMNGHGYTRTIFKRRRLFPNIKCSSPPLRAQAERQAVNFCVQGSAADLCKAAMIQVEHTLSKHKQLCAKLLVQIHDELLLEVADEDLTAVQSLVKSVMEDGDSLCGQMTKLKTPIKVSLSAGKTWGHLSPI